MAVDNKTRKAQERERKRALGLVRKEVWVHPDRLGEFEKVKEKLGKPKR